MKLALWSENDFKQRFVKEMNIAKQVSKKKQQRTEGHSSLDFWRKLIRLQKLLIFNEACDK